MEALHITALVFRVSMEALRITGLVFRNSWEALRIIALYSRFQQKHCVSLLCIRGFNESIAYHCLVFGVLLSHVMYVCSAAHIQCSCILFLLLYLHDFLQDTSKVSKHLEVLYETTIALRSQSTRMDTTIALSSRSTQRYYMCSSVDH